VGLIFGFRLKRFPDQRLQPFILNSQKTPWAQLAIQSFDALFYKALTPFAHRLPVVDNCTGILMFFIPCVALRTILARSTCACSKLRDAAKDSSCCLFSSFKITILAIFLSDMFVPSQHMTAWSIPQSYLFSHLLKKHTLLRVIKTLLP